MDIVSQLYTQSHTRCQLTVYILSMLLAKSCDIAKSCFFLLIPEIVVLILTKNRMPRKEGMQWYAVFIVILNEYELMIYFFIYFVAILNVKASGNFKIYLISAFHLAFH